MMSTPERLAPVELREHEPHHEPDERVRQREAADEIAEKVGAHGVRACVPPLKPEISSVVIGIPSLVGRPCCLVEAIAAGISALLPAVCRSLAAAAR